MSRSGWRQGCLTVNTLVECQRNWSISKDHEIPSLPDRISWWLRGSGPAKLTKEMGRLDAHFQLPKAVPTDVKVVLALVPRVVIAPMQTTMISASITAYSTAVGPSSP